MKRLGQLVTKNKFAAKNKGLPELVTSSEMTTLEIRDRALAIADGLTSTVEPLDFTAWYCKAYKTLGEGKYAAVASAARGPGVKDSKKVFGKLLSQEMRARS